MNSHHNLPRHRDSTQQQYDGSGRSLGSAIVTFETNAEATRAKNQFDGILAKGQPMSIKIASRPPIAPRRIASAPPSTLSLLNRIEKPPLLARVARDDTDASRTPTGPRGAGGRGVGPIRSRGQHQPSARGGPKNKGGRGGRESKKPKTAEDLDKEIDAFMGDSEPTAGSEPSTGAPAHGAQDVEMA
ncbi:hypothetical protein D9611_006187 [Ephemerocybe angulata]|uniref:Chromatin target of PRMT1 protein C-terminal domain-containing protein n=1 Tax=Ephemerocybe angulata TaxID=980116 RepID=A0A8H5C7W1_9AGAR|nr:hypothetical protein D9611_006187 [Tulosesus angulatus]